MNRKGLMGIVKSPKFLGVVLSLVILGALIAAGPASAFNLGLRVVGDNYAEVGEAVKVEIGMKLRDGDQYIPVRKIDFRVIPVGSYNGQGDLNCVFDVYGEVIDGCYGVTNIIQRGVNVEFGEGRANFLNSSYNFGYGYGITDDFGYRLVFDSGLYGVGDYDGQFIIYAGEGQERRIFSNRLRGMMHIIE
ncbi:hypothetical protein CO038_00745 [Candidatus Pacearchaeota archaeon CG_4_9_14_0_2_um_filter_39_13]|nr:hypothetical protein [Candidatus Pacearchaeota archaeon]OIO43841.1 MAG: hypothetical protein AUJ64_01580 [Candidatus Pacearchaeota archaeon CG1_02_39_14]PJC45011.1 MAG: hypothetical protein CO038_00745 [Candidatus Pacearchaeota archaeon CG_4_9_14_0_2_um_filter_39_13]